MATDICFVVMPFGVKPIPGDREQTFDFDKLYRVIYTRAITQAGMQPLRGDEGTGSHIVHAHMFKNLRDRDVVLADLSLANPNVFYELGARHVMSSRGTVLTCQSGTDLPFDIGLSRTIFFDYDGANLDWEEAERVVRELQAALEEARRQIPDSPVHALLQRVLPEREVRAITEPSQPGEARGRHEPLDAYQVMIAAHWRQEDRDVGALLKEVSSSAFGSRALGHLCLASSRMPEQAADVATRLYLLGEPDLANRVYEQIGDGLGFRDRLRWASSIAEEHNDIAHADLALAKVDEIALLALPDTYEAFRVELKRGGLLAWRWRLTEAPEDLRGALASLASADSLATGLLDRGDLTSVGRLAQVRLRLVLWQRRLGETVSTRSTEDLVDSILELKPQPETDLTERSYLRWYQAIAMADTGNPVGTRRLALSAFAEDARDMHRVGAEDVGRFQYVLLRRFLDQNAESFRYPELVGQISQMLQTGHAPVQGPAPLTG